MKNLKILRNMRQDIVQRHGTGQNNRDKGVAVCTLMQAAYAFVQSRYSLFSSSRISGQVKVQCAKYLKVSQYVPLHREPGRVIRMGRTSRLHNAYCTWLLFQAQELRVFNKRYSWLTFCSSSSSWSSSGSFIMTIYQY